jgi:hypothetical protein
MDQVLAAEILAAIDCLYEPITDLSEVLNRIEKQEER